MNTRAITAADLKVKKDAEWRDSKGRIRLHVSLKDASFVCRTYWVHPDQLSHQKTLETIRSDMQTILTLKVHLLARYITK